MGNVVLTEAHCRCQLRVIRESVSSKLQYSSTARPLQGGEADLGAVAVAQAAEPRKPGHLMLL
jgi:hypothetical protein